MSAGPAANWPTPLAALAAALSPAQAPVALDLSPGQWQGLADLAIDRHRVAPVLAPHLAALAAPPDVRSRILAEAQANAAQVLGHMAVTREILTRCQARGIAPALLKGWPLAQDLYGAPGNRHARDLDILVAPGDVPGAAEVLAGLGFHPAPVYRLRGRLIGSRALTEECYDLEFHHSDGVAVELHWRTNHLRGWPDLLACPGMMHEMESEIGPLRVPTDRGNLIYLSGHGGMHVWVRLKWLVDIARLAGRRGAAALAEDLAQARALNVARPVALALRLSAQIFGTPLPEGTRAQPRLERHLLRVIADPAAAPGGLRYKMLTHLAPVRMAETAGQAAGILRYATWRRLRLGAAALRKGRR